jgi:glutamate-1-semialdehyde 2,1-aminomutase
MTGTTCSNELFARARGLIPGGVNSPVRAFAAVGATPRFIERGEGPYLVDVDGNRYIDYVMSWGPLIHGHAFPPVVEAIERTARLGTSFGAPSPLEVELAAAVTSAMPSVELIRFVSSGTEAAMSAIRVARAFTGRDLIVKFAGNYHGHSDMLLVDAGSGGLTLGIPSSPGVPAGATATTIVASYNDVAALEAIFGAHGRQIAAVIVEPIAGNMGVVVPDLGFLEAARRLTANAGGLLIADEVITGFRVAHGGAQALFDLQPDLTVLGKIIGGGLPVGAYGGREDIMRLVAPDGPVYQAGTLSGNPLAMAAGLAGLAPLNSPAFYERLSEATNRLAEGLAAVAGDANIRLTINRVTGLLTAFFSGGPVRTVTDAKASDAQAFAHFHAAMLRRGVYLPPSQYEAWMISSAHADEIIDQTLAAAADSLRELA